MQANNHIAGNKPTNFSEFAREAGKLIPAQRRFTDPLRTLAYGTDASFYRLIPKLVIHVETTDEVSALLKLAVAHNTPVTFRAAGTSLSGQAITDSVLLILGTTWTDVEVGANGDWLKAEPGITGAQANRHLAPFHKKIGPDPASLDIAKLGGIVANNSSGMCCGVAANTYNTLLGMKLILSDGTTLDTRDELSRQKFTVSHSALLSKLKALAETTRNNPELSARIRHKYRLKNTTGYALNALIDFDDPINILQHLLVGSEGTLGFIADTSFKTVADWPNKTAALLFFSDEESACLAVTKLQQADLPIAAIELIDSAGLQAVAGKQGIPNSIYPVATNTTALLVDMRCETELQLADAKTAAQTLFDDFALIESTGFVSSKTRYQQLWAIRKGLFPAVGALRATGTTVIIEDIAFPVAQLAQGVKALHALFVKHNYPDALIFGHALDGNLHFVFSQGFDTSAEQARYEALMTDVANLVTHEFDGSLKAEHGTGRNMAPFVEQEWGADAYRLMWQIKELLDPDNILNPEVILSRNPKLHLQNLKPLPAADPLVDKCIECGFCEPVCPSKNMTLTPRQRIVITREIARLRKNGDNKQRLRDLEKHYEFDGIDTCAACGLCATQCPVNINTGDLTRKLRGQNNARWTPLANWLAAHFGFVSSAARLALNLAARFRPLIGKPLNGFMHWRGANNDSNVARALPSGASTKIAVTEISSSNSVVYFPSCASRVMGPDGFSDQRDALPTVTVRVLEKAGYNVVLPKQLQSLCCGMPFESKGHAQAADNSLEKLEQQLLEASDNGELPIVFDTSPCVARRLRSAKLDKRLSVFEPADFIEQHVLNKLVIKPLPSDVAVHQNCSAVALGKQQALINVVAQCANQAVVPQSVSCCGFAGDKGFSLPALNASALKDLKQDLNGGCSLGVSTSRTCEIGLSAQSGISYQSIFNLVDAVSSAKISTNTE